MSEIYLGRIVAIGRNQAGRLAALYRVSSRSFPNRQAIIGPTAARIVPKAGHEGDVVKNPYIAYNCARIVGSTGIVTNGSHTDPIAEKIATGMSIRDALTLSLLALDYEHDDYDTPRIAAVVRAGESDGWLGVVRKDGIEVRSFALEPGQCFWLSTYEHNRPCREHSCAFDAGTAEAACAFAMGQGAFAKFTNAVTSVCLLQTDGGYEIAATEK